MCLGHTALGETTVGQVINLISNDASRFDTTLPGIQYLLIGPVQTVIVTYLVWREIGIASLVGVLTLFILIPVQGLKQIEINLISIMHVILKCISRLVREENFRIPVENG